MRNKTIVASLLFILLSIPAFSFGPRGHGVICAVAERNVKASTRRQVESYLGRSMPFFAVWCDEFRDDPAYRHTSYHMVEVDGDFHYVPSVGRMDLVQLIEHAMEVIKDRRNQSDSTVAVQLKILIHAVGDLHTPVHVRYPAEMVDRSFKVYPYKGEDKLVSYHSVWDEQIINRRFAGLSTRDIAYDIDRWPRKEIKEAQKGSVVDWAEEQARKNIEVYSMAKAGEVLFKPFYNKAWPMVQYQMALGGYRLAKLLEECF